jgi:serine protease
MSRYLGFAAGVVGPLTVASLVAATILHAPSPTPVARNDAGATAVHRPFERTDRLIVRLRDDVPGGDTSLDGLALPAQIPLRPVRRTLDGAHVLHLGRALNAADVRAIARRLARDPRVAHAEPDYRLKTASVDDPYFAYQWSIGRVGASAWGVGAPDAWAAGYTGTGVVVAIVDSGVLPHRDIADRLLPGYDFVSQDAPNTLPGGIHATANDGNGRDADASDPGNWLEASEKGVGPFVDCPETGPTPALRPSEWHGTRMAGIVAATANNGYGIAGIAPDASILPVRVIGKCGGYIADIADGIRWANGLGVAGAPANPNVATVILLGMDGQLPVAADPCPATLQNAITDVTIVGGRGQPVAATLVAALGNGGVRTIDRATYDGHVPAKCMVGRGIVATATDREGQLAPYSNALGAARVEVVAGPGGSVPPGTVSSDAASGGILSLWNSGQRGPVADDFAWLSGTSEAAAHVAGVAALIRQQRGGTTAYNRAAIVGLVTPFPAGSVCRTGNTSTLYCGEGIVSAAYAVGGVAPRTGGTQPTSLNIDDDATAAPASATSTAPSATGTGSGGGGCTVAPDGSPDIALAMLVLAAFARVLRASRGTR